MKKKSLLILTVMLTVAGSIFFALQQNANAKIAPKYYKHLCCPPSAMPFYCNFDNTGGILCPVPGPYNGCGICD